MDPLSLQNFKKDWINFSKTSTKNKNNPKIPAKTLLDMESESISDLITSEDQSIFIDFCSDSMSYFDIFENDNVKQFESNESFSAFAKKLKQKIVDENLTYKSNQVQYYGSTAVSYFSFYDSLENAKIQCTNVYNKNSDKWKLIHMHWIEDHQNHRKDHKENCNTLKISIGILVVSTISLALLHFFSCQK